MLGQPTETTKKIDQAIRMIARETGKADSHRFNYYAKWEQCEIRATFGAGTNSCRLVLDDANDGIVLYEAMDYGRLVVSFRDGKWVSRIVATAEELKRLAELRAASQAQRELDETAARFEQIDY